MTKIAVVCAIYNEGKILPRLLDALLVQTRPLDEIVIVDDGSTDDTPEICRRFCGKHPFIKFYYQKNQGPASARNTGWKKANADICVFTDGDCVPEKNWIENLIIPLADEKNGASAGTYKTLNHENALAKFIGLEIAWRYRKVSGNIDVHGAYNLAVRKKILEEMGGFKEDYPKPSGEDWDLTYRISKKYPIIFVPTAIVGHEHPEKLIPYLANQMRRAYDRIKVYRTHPEKISGDVYTGRIIKYQIIAAGLFIPSLFLLLPWFPFGFLIPSTLFLFLAMVTLIPFSYLFKNDPKIAFYGIWIQWLRSFAWFAGALAGFIKFGSSK